MNHKTLRWFIRLLVWPFVLLTDAVDEDISPDALFSDIAWFVSGFVCLVIPLISFAYKIGNNNLANLIKANMVYIFLVCLVIYLILGIISFFSRKVTNIGIPWQDNGRW